MPYFIDRHFIVKLHDYVNHKDTLKVLMTKLDQNSSDVFEETIKGFDKFFSGINNEFLLVKDHDVPVNSETVKNQEGTPNIYSESEYQMILKVLKSLLLLKFYFEELSLDDARVIHGNTQELFSRIILYFSDSLAYRKLISHCEHQTNNSMNFSMLKYIRTSVLAAIRRSEMMFKRSETFSGVSLELEDALRQLVRIVDKSHKYSEWERFTQKFPGMYSARIFNDGDWVFEDLNSSQGVEAETIFDYFLRLYDPTILVLLDIDSMKSKFWQFNKISVYKVLPCSDLVRDFKFEELSFTKDLGSRHESKALLNSILSSIYHSFPFSSDDPYYSHSIDFKDFFEDGVKGIDKLGGLGDGIKFLHSSLKKVFTNALKLNGLHCDQEHDFKRNPLLKIQSKKSTRYNCKFPGTIMFISKNS